MTPTGHFILEKVLVRQALKYTASSSVMLSDATLLQSCLKESLLLLLQLNSLEEVNRVDDTDEKSDDRDGEEDGKPVSHQHKQGLSMLLLYMGCT